MCAACNPSEVHAATAEAIEPAPGAQPGAKFGALRNRDCRTYLGGGLLSMCADNVEQHISQSR